MLTVINTEFDLGTIPKGKLVHHTISIINPTNEPVFINPIGTSCSCTSGICTPNPIPASETGEMQITFNPDKVGRGDMIKTGVISWTIRGQYFSSNFKFKVNVE